MSTAVRSLRWLENCCICCGDPTNPSMEALRRESLGCLACVYIDRASLRNRDEWNIKEPPNLLGERQGLHMFHVSSFLPVHEMFTVGVGKDMWGDESTVMYNAFNCVDSALRSRALLRTISPMLPVEQAKYSGEVDQEIMFFNTKNNKNATWLVSS
jgi:hypothetical protein